MRVRVIAAPRNPAPSTKIRLCIATIRPFVGWRTGIARTSSEAAHPVVWYLFTFLRWSARSMTEITAHSLDRAGATRRGGSPCHQMSSQRNPSEVGDPWPPHALLVDPKWISLTTFGRPLSASVPSGERPAEQCSPRGSDRFLCAVKPCPLSGTRVGTTGGSSARWAGGQRFALADTAD